MEKCDIRIRTEHGNLNREIEVTNQRLRQLKVRIGKFQNWLKEEQASTEPTTLADYIQSILSRKAQAGKSGVSQSLYNLNPKLTKSYLRRRIVTSKAC